MLSHQRPESADSQESGVMPTKEEPPAALSLELGAGLAIELRVGGAYIHHLIAAIPSPG
jgi:hypothetical protein